MSQAGIYDDSATPLPDIETLTGDSGGPVGPNAGNINVFGVDSATNIDNGITTVGTPGSSLLEVTLTNRTTGTVTTSDATLTTIQTFALGATPGVFYVYGNVQCFSSGSSVGGAFSFSGGYRTDGATVIELGTEFHDDFKDVSLNTADIFLDVSGSDVLLQVQGVAATTLDWNSLLEFRQVT